MNALTNTADNPAPSLPFTVGRLAGVSTSFDESDEFRREPQRSARLLVAVASDNGAALILFDPIPPQSDPVECAVIEGVYSEVVQ